MHYQMAKSSSSRTMEDSAGSSINRQTSSERHSMTPEELRASLITFYQTHDPPRVPAIDMYFMTWIESNGIDSFNELLFLKYGEGIPLAPAHSRAKEPIRFVPVEQKPIAKRALPPQSDAGPSFGDYVSSTLARAATFAEASIKQLPPLDIERFKAQLNQTSIDIDGIRNQLNLPPIDIERIKYQLIALVLIVFLFLFRRAFGYLATTNLILLGVGLGVTSYHMIMGSKRKRLSSSLHVYWILYCYSSLWESFLPETVREHWEYSFFKSVLFVYVFLPNRMFREDGGGATTVVRVKLVTIARDLAFFFVEICLLLFFNNNADGRLRFREVLFLIVLGLVYIVGVRTLKNRDRVIEEIYLTEDQFATHLRTFKTAYVPALADAITTEEMEILTRHLEPIIALSELFSHELRIAMAKDLVGPAFDKFVPFFKMYGPFCADHDAKRELVERLRARANVAQILDEVASPNTDKPKVQAIESYLIMPVQRIPRYVLLLNEVVKKTPFWHPDYENCVKVLEKVSDVAKSVNEAIGSHAALPQKASAFPVPFMKSGSRFGLSRADSSASTIMGGSSS